MTKRADINSINEDMRRLKDADSGKISSRRLANSDTDMADEFKPSQTENPAVHKGQEEGID